MEEYQELRGNEVGMYIVRKCVILEEAGGMPGLGLGVSGSVQESQQVRNVRRLMINRGSGRKWGDCMCRNNLHAYARANLLPWTSTMQR